MKKGYVASLAIAAAIILIGGFRYYKTRNQ